MEEKKKEKEFILNLLLENYYWGAGAVTQKLRACVMLVKDLSSVPSTCCSQIPMPSNSSSRASFFSSSFCGHGTQVHIPTHRQMHATKT